METTNSTNQRRECEACGGTSTIERMVCRIVVGGAVVYAHRDCQAALAARESGEVAK